jgi:FAD:protein FMN transferase
MPRADHLVRRARPWLGTIVEIAVPRDSEAAMEAGFVEIARIHTLMSFHSETSDLARLRTACPGEIVAIAPDTVNVLRIAAALNRASGGLFDITVGRELVRTHFLPRMTAMQLGQIRGKASDIDIIDDCHVRLRRRMLIDLGGIAKGYAVDCAVAALESAGVMAGMVNAGGDLRVFGDAALPIEVRMGHGALSAPFHVQDRAVASSENLHNRRSMKGRVTTPHIGRDGHAVVADQTVTVIASTCVIADAMTSVAMVDPDMADRLLVPHGGYVVRYARSEVA